MKNKTVFVLIVLAAVALYISSSRFKDHPVPLFLLRGGAESVEAFKVGVCFGGQESLFETVALNQAQSREAADILAKRNAEQLRAFSKNFGDFIFVSGEPGGEEGWPAYLGGKFKIFNRSDLNNTLGNLSVMDRCYWAFNTKVPESKTASDGIGTKAPSQKVEVIDLNLDAKPTADVKQDTGVVRVEILNGCGITNAADWAAKRVKGPYVVITDTGNADNFKYPKTVVKTSVGVPVALEEALERLGLTSANVEEIPAPSASFDVIVIIGRDYPKLKRAVK